MNPNSEPVGVPRKKRFHVFLAFLVLALPSLLFVILADLPHILFLACIGGVVSFLVARPVRYSDRSVIYSLVVSLVAAVLFNLFFPMDENRTGIIGGVLQAQIMVPFLIYLAIAATFFPSTPHVIGIAVCFSLGILMLDGEMLTAYTSSRRIPMISAVLVYGRTIFAAAVSLEMLLVVLALNVAWNHETAPLAWRRRIPKVAAFVAASAITALLSVWFITTFRANQNRLLLLEQHFLRLARMRASQPGKILFDSNVDLNSTLRESMVDNADKIVLRSSGGAAPGYLRGRAYTTYEAGRWRDDSAARTTLDATTHAGILAYTTYHVSGRESVASHRHHILTAASFSVDVLLLPGNTRHVDLVAGNLQTTLNGTFHPEDWERDGGYTCHVEAENPESAFPLPAFPPPPSLFVVPENLEIALERELASLGGEATVSPAELVRRIVAHFHRKFEYSLEPRTMLPDEDPIAAFLRVRRGHCELFAAATALLLRKAGIASRYVTGFICEEEHPSGAYYVARVANAHAWCEADLGEGLGWVLVESTPPSAMPGGERHWGMAESWFDYLRHLISRTIADMRRGLFAEAIIRFFRETGSLFRLLFWNPLRGPLALLALAAIVWRWRRRGKTRDAAGIVYSPRFQALRGEFAKAESLYAGLTGRSRNPSMTIDEFLASVKSAGSELDQRFARICAEYQKIRYRPESAGTEQEISDCMKSLRDFRTKRLARGKKAEPV